MISFREYVESDAPATTTTDVGKPEGGQVKKKDPPEEQSDFQKIFGNIFKDLFKDRHPVKK